MHPDQAQNARDTLRSQLAFHRKLSLGLTCAALILGCDIAWMAVNSTVAIVPPELKRPYQIGANFGDAAYLADMSDYVLDMICNVSPETVDHNNKVILKLTDPDGYAELNTALDAAALRIKRDHISTVWNPRKEEVYQRDKRVKVSGKLKTYVANQPASEPDKQYIVEFKIGNSGRLYVYKVKEVEKSDPVRPAGL